MQTSSKSLRRAALVGAFVLLCSCSSHQQTLTHSPLDIRDNTMAEGILPSDDVEDIEAEPAEPEEYAGEEIAALNRLGGWDESPVDGDGRVGGYVLSKHHYDFPVVINRQVGYYLDLFRGKQREMFARWLDRSAQYVPAIEPELAKAGLPRDLAYLAMIESGYNPSAVSHAGAGGLWQFMPATGRHYDLVINSWVDERRDPEKATRAAIRYLGNLYRQFGDWHLAVAAYNTGEGNVDRAIREHGTANFWDLAAKEGLYRETRHYVPKLIAAIIIARDPATYGFDAPSPGRAQRSEIVRVPGNTDLRAAAETLGVSLRQMRSLNNELLRDVTPPNGGRYALRVPEGGATLIAANIERLQHRPAPTYAGRSGYATHVVRKGDTLHAVSQRYGVSMTNLLKANKLRTSRLLAGQRLRIPTRGAVMAAKNDPTRSPAVMASIRKPAKQVHQIRKGDTLSGIAKKYGVSEIQIRQWNKLSPKRALAAGQKLTLYRNAPVVADNRAGRAGSASGGKQVALIGAGKSRNAAPVAVVSTAGKGGRETVRKAPEAKKGTGAKSLIAQSKAGGGQAPKAAKPSWYVVKKGDSMATIARKFSVSVNDIRQWNKLSSNKLQVGNRLLVRKG